MWLPARVLLVRGKHSDLKVLRKTQYRVKIYYHRAEETLDRLVAKIAHLTLF